MTAKQSASGLVDKFKQIHSTSGGIGLSKKQAKECALIAVDEKIETLLSCIGEQKHFWTEHEKEVMEHLEAVKQEIQNL